MFYTVLLYEGKSIRKAEMPLVKILDSKLFIFASASMKCLTSERRLFNHLKAFQLVFFFSAFPLVWPEGRAKAIEIEKVSGNQVYFSNLIEMFFNLIEILNGMRMGFVEIVILEIKKVHSA